MKPRECAHCSDGVFGDRASMDDGRARRCPACNQNVCPSCRAMSGPQTCGSYADGDENAADIANNESKRQQRARLVAAGASSYFATSGGYPLLNIDKLALEQNKAAGKVIDLMDALKRSLGVTP